MSKWYLLFFVLLLASCYRDEYRPEQVSLSIEEAKAKKVFIKEYKVCDVKMLTNDSKQLINKIWIEKYWRLTKDKDGNEVPDICDSCVYNIVYSLNPDEQLNGDNFVEKWTLMDDNKDSPVGSICGMPVTTIYTKKLPDSLTFNIVKLVRPFERKDPIYIERFTIKL